MILDEEFDKLFQIVSLISKGQLTSAELLQVWETFLKRLKDELKDAPEEEKKKVRVRLKQLAEEINTELFGVIKNAGMTSEQLRDFADNPNNYESDQWGAIKSSQKESGKLAHEVGGLLSPTKKGGESPPPSAPQKKKKISKGAKARKRGAWVRS